MTPAEYAERHGKSLRTVERWLAAGELPTASQNEDGRWHIPADAVRQQPLTRQHRQSTDVSVTRRSVSAPEPSQPQTLAEALDRLPALLTVEEAAPLLGVKPSRVRRQARELEGLRWGDNGTWLIPQYVVRRLAFGPKGDVPATR